MAGFRQALYCALCHWNADALLPGQPIPAGIFGLGGGRTQRRILSQYDAGMVLRNGSGQAAGGNIALAHRAAAGCLDAQQDHSKGSGKLPHYAGNEAAAPPASHSYNGRQSLKGRKSGEEKECWRLRRNTSELTVNALCLSHEAQRKGKTLESPRASSVFCHHGRSGGIR